MFRDRCWNVRAETSVIVSMRWSELAARWLRRSGRNGAAKLDETPRPSRTGQSRLVGSGLAGQVVLALPPTLTVLGVLLLIEQLAKQRVLFASLAASAFLIYRDPAHPMNGVRRMLTAHLLGVALGGGAAFLLWPGYLAVVIGTTATIALLIFFDLVHPPAISTALLFAFFVPEIRTLGLFLLALLMLAGLVVVQRAALWIVHWVNDHRPDGGPALPDPSTRASAGRRSALAGRTPPARPSRADPES